MFFSQCIQKKKKKRTMILVGNYCLTFIEIFILMKDNTVSGYLKFFPFFFFEAYFIYMGREK